MADSAASACKCGKLLNYICKLNVNRRLMYLC